MREEQPVKKFLDVLFWIAFGIGLLLALLFWKEVTVYEHSGLVLISVMLLASLASIAGRFLEIRKRSRRVKLFSILADLLAMAGLTLIILLWQKVIAIERDIYYVLLCIMTLAIAANIAARHFEKKEKDREEREAQPKESGGP